ncbi:MAG: hypothetical protein GVY36_02660 [Verrucomicrobia bacterium]|nr:hypothetical protein [Verrucomicrobiota bacterium]
MTISPSEFSHQLRWLKAHRLLGVSDLLCLRGYIHPNVNAIAQKLVANERVVSGQILEEEDRVFSSGLANFQILALKGVRLAYSVYPDATSRPRSDIDLLVAPDSLAPARSELAKLGYRPLRRTLGGTPGEQEAWLLDSPSGPHLIDLHWKLRNHPCLRDRLSFDEQWSSAIPLPRLGQKARGQSAGHALLNACMHWFDTINPQRYPLLWLLDKDLLWRDMTESEHLDVLQLAGDRGLGGLLAESLRLTRKAFGTPIDQDVIEALDRSGRGRTPTRLINARKHRFRAFCFTISSEPGLRGKLWRLRQSIFPPPEYMRMRFPDGSRLGLAGLYWRRIRRRL